MEGTCWMCFEKRHLHAALEGCDKYLYPRLYPFHSIRIEPGPNDTQLGLLMDSHQSMQTMPHCFDADAIANGLAFGAGTQPTLQNACPRSLSPLPLTHTHTHSPTIPNWKTDAKQRRKMKIEKQAAALVEETTTTSSKNKKQKKTKITKKTTTENTQILICRHFSRY